MEQVNAYSPASSVGWLDFDSQASERVGTLLRSLEEPGTLDVLGLGTVRDAFSEMLSPGTSTVQTRLRYFVFLPWIFGRLENQRVVPSEFADQLRNDEALLIDCLRHLGPNQGVIGRNAGRDLKRMPSAVYWGGLGSWGIRRHDLSLAEYGRRAASFGRLKPERDDDGNAANRSMPMWARVPPPPDDFLHGEISFELKQVEAQFLTDQIQQNHKGTLLALLCSTPDAASVVDHAWDLPLAGMPDGLVEVLRHARSFSEITAGPQHVYNLLLARKANVELQWDTEELERRVLADISTWVDLIFERREELFSWVKDLPEFWEFLIGWGVGVGPQTFITALAERAVENPEKFANDPEVHDLICGQELRLKSQRARLTHRAALENWNQQPVGGQLDYRWPTTRSFLADIAAARRTA